MTDERRYQDDEIAEIFEAAAAPQDASRRGVSREHGLTLAELQSIGREVGVSPDRIADAAVALDRRHTAVPRRTDLRMPIAVGQTIELSRPLTDREWGLVVADLRQTFNAQGKDASRGDLRAWTNGNLHAYVEPTQSGYRLRLGTLKSDAVAVNRLGLGGVLMGAVVLVGGFLAPGLVNDLSAPAILSGLGAVGLVYNSLRLSRWSLERERQMDQIATRVLSLVSATPAPTNDVT